MEKSFLDRREEGLASNGLPISVKKVETDAELVAHLII
jgi:hypothetical protein